MTESAIPPDSPATDSARRSRATAAMVRWARLCVYGAFGLLLASELLGGTWPFVLITPAVPKLGVLASIGLLLTILSARRGTVTSRCTRVRLAIGAVTAFYCFAVAYGLVPWRVVPPAIVRVSANDANPTVTVLSANVHTGNTDHARLLQLIEREQPDIILLMELDTAWLKALEPLRERYPVSRTVPDDAGNFGIGFWTRLKVIDADLTLLKPEEPGTLNDVPQVRAELELTDGSGNAHAIRFLGLHPLPPVRPAWKSARDAVLEGAAKEIRDHAEMPTIVAGDLNATRYCRVVQRLARNAHLTDAAAPFGTSWPNTWSRPVTGIRIDHLLLTPHWRVSAIDLSHDIGSDHSPILAKLVLER